MLRPTVHHIEGEAVGDCMVKDVASPNVAVNTWAAALPKALCVEE